MLGWCLAAQVLRFLMAIKVLVEMHGCILNYVSTFFPESLVVAAAQFSFAVKHECAFFCR